MPPGHSRQNSRIVALQDTCEQVVETGPAVAWDGLLGCEAPTFLGHQQPFVPQGLGNRYWVMPLRDFGPRLLRDVEVPGRNPPRLGLAVAVIDRNHLAVGTRDLDGDLALDLLSEANNIRGPLPRRGLFPLRRIRVGGDGFALLCLLPRWDAPAHAVCSRS